MSTQLETAIGDAKVINEKTVTGPRGGQESTIKYLSDGRVAVITPDLHGNIPVWLEEYLPEKHVFVRRGGTTYKWSGWISELASY